MTQKLQIKTNTSQWGGLNSLTVTESKGAITLGGTGKLVDDNEDFGAKVRAVQIANSNLVITADRNAKNKFNITNATVGDILCIEACGITKYHVVTSVLVGS